MLLILSTKIPREKLPISSSFALHHASSFSFPCLREENLSVSCRLPSPLVHHDARREQARGDRQPFHGSTSHDFYFLLQLAMSPGVNVLFSFLIWVRPWRVCCYIYQRTGNTSFYFFSLWARVLCVCVYWPVGIIDLMLCLQTNVNNYNDDNNSVLPYSPLHGNSLKQCYSANRSAANYEPYGLLTGVIWCCVNLCLRTRRAGLMTILSNLDILVSFFI